MYYFLAFNTYIRGFIDIRKVIMIDDTHLHGKYDDVLLSIIAQDTENRIYPIAFML